MSLRPQASCCSCGGGNIGPYHPTPSPTVTPAPTPEPTICTDTNDGALSGPTSSMYYGRSDAASGAYPGGIP